MIIVEIKNNDNIERALKNLKSKVIKTKQNQQLQERKEYTKKSVLKRAQLLKAVYIQKKKNQLD
jgi:small subunit ribosomal protein S21